MAREVGIVIVAKDAATKTLAGIGKTAKLAASATAALGRTGASSISLYADAVSLVNQGLEIAQKAQAAWRFAVLDTVAAAAQARREGDAARDFFIQWQIESERTKLAIGEALLPVIKGTAEAFKLNKSTLNDLISEHRKFIALNVAEIFAGIGTVAFQIAASIAKMAETVGALRIGFLQLKNSISDTVVKVSDGLLELTGNLEAFGSLLPKALGRNIKKSAQESREALVKLRQSFQGAGEDLNTVRAEVEKQNAETRKGLEDFAAGVAGAFAQASQNIKKLSGDIKSANEVITQTQRERMAKEKALRETAAKERNDQVLRDAEMSIREGERVQREWISQQEERGAIAADVGNRISAAFSTAAAAAITGSESAEDAFKKFGESALDIVFQTALTQITNAAAVGAAEAFKSQSGIPVVGPVLGVFAAGLVGAAILAFKSQLQKKAVGGIVSGGTPGVDSVPALLKPGELVIPAEQTRRMMGGQPQQANNVTINTTVTATELPQRQQRMRVTNSLAKSIEEAMADGRIRVPGVT